MRKSCIALAAASASAGRYWLPLAWRRRPSGANTPHDQPAGVCINVPAGFTLVEMLVAVGLVMLLMVMFAQIFTTATGQMSTYKGIGENDQRARLFTTVIQADLDKRTMRRVAPMFFVTPNDPATTTINEEAIDPNAALESSALQGGYFYYSENDPADDTDDVLQFTATVTNTQKNADTTPVYGRSTALAGTNVYSARNQPEFDDGLIAANNTTESTVYEVAYFLRRGVLYRRVLLVRTPFFSDDSNLFNAKPSRDNNTDLLDNTKTYGEQSSPLNRSFYEHFDFSAYNLEEFTLGKQPQFHGAVSGASNSLFNGYVSGVTGGQFPAGRPLGIPNLRFGHNVMLTGNAGRPREFVSSYVDSAGVTQNRSAFIGRFTLEECSHPEFAYPGSGLAVNNPHIIGSLVLNRDGVVVQDLADPAKGYAAGVRRGEDILMTNVHAFDVKILDDYVDPAAPGDVTVSVNEFKDLGYSESPQGYYGLTEIRNQDYGPKTVGKGVDGEWGVANEDDDGNGTDDDVSEQGWPGSDDDFNRVFDTWHPNVDLNADGAQDEPPFHYYRSDWNTNAAVRKKMFGLDAAPGRAGIDDDQDGRADTNADGSWDVGEIGWIGSDDRHPVKAIQLKIRFLDPASQLMREVTLVHSLAQ